MWAAGAGKFIRGAKWTFERGADVSNAGIGNGRPEVFSRDQAWWDNHFMNPNEQNAVAAAIIWRSGCSVASLDMVFHSEKLAGSGAGSYKLVRPSIGDDDRFSLAHAAGHEFGHWFGLAHEDDAFPTLMNTAYPSSGDIGQNYRVGEDEVVALQELKPDESVGVNLLVGKFTKDLDGPESVSSEWNPPEVTTSGGSCSNSATVAQHYVWLHSHSTESLYNVKVQWELSPDDDCGDSDQVTWGSKVLPGISMNVPVKVRPSSLCVPSGTVAGSYRVCVRVDPDSDISETSELDNLIRYDRVVTIEN